MSRTQTIEEAVCELAGSLSRTNELLSRILAFVVRRDSTLSAEEREELISISASLAESAKKHQKIIVRFETDGNEN